MGGIPYAAGIMNFVIVSAALSGMNTNVYLCSRMLFSLSRGGYAPRLLGRLSEGRRAGGARWRCRASASWSSAALCAVTPRPTPILQGIALFGMITVWITILLSHLRFRRVHKAADLPVRMPFFPVMQLVGLGLLPPWRSPWGWTGLEPVLDRRRALAAPAEPRLRRLEKNRRRPLKLGNLAGGCGRYNHHGGLGVALIPGGRHRLEIRILRGPEIRQLLTMDTCIGLMKTTMIAVSEGRARIPLRSVLPVSGGGLMGNHAGLPGGAGVLRRQAAQPVPGQLRRRLFLAPGPRPAVRARPRPAGGDDGRRRDHRHPHRRGQRPGDPAAGQPRRRRSGHPRRGRAGPQPPGGHAGGAGDPPGAGLVADAEERKCLRRIGRQTAWDRDRAAGGRAGDR